jgi:hypothetical protein
MYGSDGQVLVDELRRQCRINASHVHSLLRTSSASTKSTTVDSAGSGHAGTGHPNGRTEASDADEQSETERGQFGGSDGLVVSVKPVAILDFSVSWRERKRQKADLNAAYARHLGRNGPEAGRQEELLEDARAWAAATLREAVSEVQDVLELKQRVVKQMWDKFVPTHPDCSDLQLDYRKFGSALWGEGWPSLEDLAFDALRERAASEARQAEARVTGSPGAGRGGRPGPVAGNSAQGIAEGAIVDILTELFDQLSPEEKAHIRAAEAAANGILAQGDAGVRERSRAAGLRLELDRDWLLQPQDEARVGAAATLFVAYNNVFWARTDPGNAESIQAFLAQLRRINEGVLARYGSWECGHAIAEFRAESEKAAWLQHSRHLMSKRADAETQPPNPARSASLTTASADVSGGQTPGDGPTGSVAADQRPPDRGVPLELFADGHDGRPLGDNPFPPDHQAYQTFEEATWKAKEAINGLRAELLQVFSNPPFDFIQAILNFRVRGFGACANAALVIVGNERTAEWYEQWIEDFARFIVDDTLRKGQLKDPQADPNSPVLFTQELLPRIAVDLKLQAMKVAVRYKKEAANRVLQVMALRAKELRADSARPVIDDIPTLALHRITEEHVPQPSAGFTPEDSIKSGQPGRQDLLEKLSERP